MRFLSSRTTFLLLILIVSLLLATACGGDEEPTPEPTAVPPAPTAAPPPPTPTPLPAQPATAEPAPADAAAPVAAVSVGINAEFKPFVYLDDSGEATGFDVELMNALAQIGGFEVGYTDMPFEALLESVASGQQDAAISAITITEERGQFVDFTAPYFEAGQAPVSYLNAGQGLGVRTDNTTIINADSLGAEHTIGVKQGTTGDAFVTDNIGATVSRFAEAPQALEALSQGAVDAVVIDIPVLVDYIKTHPEAGIKLTGGPVTDEKYGIVVSKAKPEVLSVLEAALAEVRANGTYDALFNKWFGAP